MSMEFGQWTRSRIPVFPGNAEGDWHMLKQKTNMKKQKLDEIGDWLEFRSSPA